MVVQRYLVRMKELRDAGEVEADLQRRSSWAVGAQRAFAVDGHRQVGPGN